MTSSSPAPVDSEDQAVASEAFLACLKEEAEKIQAEFDNITPMIAQARALLWLDTLARLHEAGLEEAINANDPRQASAWTRDLSLFEVVISLIRNIQPMDLGEAAAAAEDGTAGDSEASISLN